MPTCKKCTGNPADFGEYKTRPIKVTGTRDPSREGGFRNMSVQDGEKKAQQGVDSALKDAKKRGGHRADKVMGTGY